RQLAGTLHGARERIGLFVGGRARRFEQDVGAQLSLEKEISGLTRLGNDRGEKMPARRSLFPALGQLFSQSPQHQQVRLGMKGSHRGLPQTVLMRRTPGPS